MADVLCGRQNDDFLENMRLTQTIGYRMVPALSDAQTITPEVMRDCFGNTVLRVSWLQAKNFGDEVEAALYGEEEVNEGKVRDLCGAIARYFFSQKGSAKIVPLPYAPDSDMTTEDLLAMEFPRLFAEDTQEEIRRHEVTRKAWTWRTEEFHEAEKKVFREDFSEYFATHFYMLSPESEDGQFVVMHGVHGVRTTLFTKTRCWFRSILKTASWRRTIPAKT